MAVKKRKRSRTFDDVELDEGFKEWQKTGTAPTWMTNESRPWRERKTVDDIEGIAEGVISEEKDEVESQTRLARQKRKKKK